MLDNKLLRKLGGYELLFYRLDLNIVALVELEKDLDLFLLHKSINQIKSIHRMSNVSSEMMIC